MTRVPTRAFDDQRPGTSGLRKKVRVFQTPHYLANFVQSIFDAVPSLQGATLVLGGDGRYYNREAIAIILRMAAANGIARVRVGRGGLLSTPAASAVIRAGGAAGGIILSASHNPGGPEADFGIKFNGANGGPAAPALTEAFHANSQRIEHYRISASAAPAIDALGEQLLDAMTVEVIDPVRDYAALLQRQFDFDLIRARLASGALSLCFDAMNAVTGPYARAILVEQLGAPASSVIRAEPLPDFGGAHPDPNLVHAAELVERMQRADAPLLGAASDGDGDRNLIHGARCYVTPSDSLAIMAANADAIPAFANGLSGVARSMPTSRAVDRVAAALALPCYETPTGWKYFGNLLDDGRIDLCGEESFGTGSGHVREKDGLWAVLFWLNLLAVRGASVEQILHAHWRRFGRDVYTRHDYEGLDTAAAEALMRALEARLPALAGHSVGGLRIDAADSFDYRDPVDNSTASGQGLRVFFANGARAVYRLSGTGTSGATLRLYLERPCAGAEAVGGDPQQLLREEIAAARELAALAQHTGRQAPDVVT